MGIYNYLGSELDVGVETDPTFTLSGYAADAKATGDALERAGVSVSEPSSSDIPELYIDGTLPTSKSDGNIKVSVTYISKTDRFSEYATLKVQGDSSSAYPKKNFTIKFYQDAQCTTKVKHNFKGWGKQNKFVMKANWIDITHARNIVSVRLWTDIVRSRSDYNSLPTAMLESPKLATIDGFPIKVYANGVYQGRYTFNIPKDAWMYNMDDSSESNVVLCADSWEGGSFTTYPALVDETDWTDEIHEDSVPQSVITKLNNFIYFIQHSTDTDFVANLTNYIDIQSFIDFYIFVQVTEAEDNCAKNVLIMSYDDSPYLASAYDFDSTWGLFWDGSELISYLKDLSLMQRNLLFVRISSFYSSQITSRYAELRNGALSDANIIHRFEEFMDIMPKELVEEDYAPTTASGAFVNIPSKNITNIQQIRDFIVTRLNYIDSILLNVYQPNTFSVIGDSYSTYGGYTNTGFRSGYDTYYPTNGDLTSVDQTWWRLLEQQTNLTLLTNDSYSGSCICYDGYGSGTSDQGDSGISFINRRSRIGYPEYLLIFGGTNDAWVPASLGSYKYSDWTEADKSYFRPALAYLIDYYQQRFPKSTIVFVKNDIFNSDYSTSIDTVCEHYGITEIQLSNISKYGNTGHPNVTGMGQIASQIKTALSL